uniref:Uncharacterized protein n=1 Tax=Aureoumbra lagunensis TaxID=44058 RepID=A0A7S3JWT4_9STRA
MPVTNRKKKKKTHGQSEFAEEKHDAEIKPKVQRRIMRRLASVVLAVIATASVQRLYKAQQMFGWLYFVPERFKHLSLSAEEWQKILEKKKVLFIGGHHRAGTTLIWNQLRRHPNVVGFGNKTGSDFSEGIFLQDVYPSFGIGRDFQKNSQSVYDPNITILETVIDVFLESILIRQPVRRRLNNSMETTKFKGLGRYALAPEDHVHWTPELKQREINAHNQARLLNKFGYHWTMSKIEDPNIKILLEKSPPNAVLSTFFTITHQSWSL